MNHYIHNLDPIIFSIGPLSVRWYGVMYLVGFTAAYLLLNRRYKQGLCALNSIQIQDIITYLLAGMLIGARSVYVFVYSPEILKDGFFNIFAVWQGGLSYHGAALGFTVAMALYGRRHKIGFLHLADNVTIGAALGVFFGRIGNFINGELYGRATDLPWGVIFPDGGPHPRHPSQLYQGICEGLIVLLVLTLINKYEILKGFAPHPSEKLSGKNKTKKWRRTGILASWYCILYGLARFLIEFVREPDAQLGYYFGWMTMGQILCLLMIAIGTIVLIWRIRKPVAIEYEVN